MKFNPNLHLHQSSNRRRHHHQMPNHHRCYIHRPIHLRHLHCIRLDLRLPTNDKIKIILIEYLDLMSFHIVINI